MMTVFHRRWMSVLLVVLIFAAFFRCLSSKPISIPDWYAANRDRILLTLDKNLDSGRLDRYVNTPQTFLSINRDENGLVWLSFAGKKTEESEYLTLTHDLACACENLPWLSDFSEEEWQRFRKQGQIRLDGLGTNQAGYVLLQVLDDHCIYLDVYIPT